MTNAVRVHGSSCVTVNELRERSSADTDLFTAATHGCECVGVFVCVRSHHHQEHNSPTNFPLESSDCFFLQFVCLYTYGIFMFVFCVKMQKLWTVGFILVHVTTHSQAFCSWKFHMHKWIQFKFINPYVLSINQNIMGGHIKYWWSRWR